MGALKTAAMFLLTAATVAGVTGTAEARESASARAATSTTTTCPTGWGSLAKSAGTETARPLTSIRTGQSPCFDRMVVDTGGVTGKLRYHVGYVDTLHQDASGEPIPVKGGAILQIYVSSPSYDPDTMKPTYGGRAGQPLPGVDLTGYQTFRDTRFAVSFEGQTQIGLGVRARLPFRVTQWDDKLIIDVAHTW
ncbi:hypothetical protein AB0A69_29230 [Streptomyces sp. NPDC045431]|uniref:AMIN-like domain-containing (lipo)protein n=1 Tax=Streptomyces sp. NPDC045431 TaxID=3155613 RepID=UPI0033DDC511